MKAASLTLRAPLLALAVLSGLVAGLAPVGRPLPASAAAPSDGEISILFVGGDLVIGQCSAATNIKAPWRDDVLSALQQDYIVSALGTQWGPEPRCYVAPDRNHEGYDQKADELLPTLQASLPNVLGTPDVVVLLAGAEDLEAGESVASTKVDLQALMTELDTAFPAAAQMIAQIPPVNGIDPTALNIEIADLATTNSATLLDFNTGVSLDVPDGFFDVAGSATVAARTITAIETVLSPAPMGTLEISSVKASQWGLGTNGVSNTIGAWDARGWAIEQIDNTIYVGGRFLDVTNGTSVGDQAYLAAFDADTGEWQSWFRPVLNRPVFALEKWTDTNGKDWLFVGGEMGGNQYTYNGAQAGALVKVDPATGDMDPNWTTVVDDATFRHVRDVKVEADGNLYAVGNFNIATDSVATYAVSGAVRMSPETGIIDPDWLPMLTVSSASDGSGTGWGVSRSYTEPITYIAGFFGEVNGDTNTRGFAGIDDSGNVVVNRFPLLPFNGCSQANYCQQLYDVQATPAGTVFVVGVEHSMYTFSESPNELIYHNYTGCNPERPENKFELNDVPPSSRTCFGRNWYGGEFQELEMVGNRIYASHHGWTDHYGTAGAIPDLDTNNFDANNWPNGLPFFRHANPSDWPEDIEASTVSAVGAYDIATGERIPTFRPKLTGEAGGFAIHEATDGCVWLAGGINSYNPTPGVNDAARDLARMCPPGGPGSNGPIGISAPPVPVSCDALKDGTTVTISWTTEQGNNAEFSRVERSNDGGATWASIGGPFVYSDGSTTQDFSTGAIYRVANRYFANQLSETTDCTSNIVSNLASPASCAAVFVFDTDNNPDPDSVAVTWDDAVDAERYILRRSRDFGSFDVTGSVVDGGDPTHTFSQTLPSGSVWAYTVESRNDTDNINSQPVDCDGPDFTDPEVDIAGPADGSTVSGNLVITGTATDNVDVAAVNIAVTQQGTGLFLQTNGTFSATENTFPATLDTPGGTSTGFTVTITVPATAVVIEATASDTFGNEASDSSSASTLVAPTSCAATLDGQIATISWTGALGVSSYEIQRADGGIVFNTVGTATGTSYTSATLPADITYTFRVLSTDAVGNIGSETLVCSPDLTPVVPDNVAPVASIGSPSVNFGDVTNVVTVSGTVVDETAAANVRIYLRNTLTGLYLQPDGVSFGPYAGPFVQPTDSNDASASFSFDLPVLPEDLFYLVVRGGDLAGNNEPASSFDTIYFNVVDQDSTPPVASIGSPSVNFGDVTNVVTVSGTVVDETAAANVRIYLRNTLTGLYLQPDGVSFGPYAGPFVQPTDSNDASASFSFDLPVLPEDLFYLVVRGGDLAGNNEPASSFDTIYFNVVDQDSTPPVASIGSPSVNFGDVTNVVTVSGTVVDETAAANVRIYLRNTLTGLYLQPDGVSFGPYAGPFVQPTDSNDASASFSFDLPVLPEDLFYLVVRGGDLAGNNEPASSFDTIYFNVVDQDSTPPVASIGSPSVNFGDVTNVVTVSGTVVDETAAANVRIYLRNTLTGLYLQPDGVSFGPYAGPFVQPTDSNDASASFSFDLPVLPEDLFYLVVRGGDLAGNNEPASSFDTIYFNVNP